MREALRLLDIPPSSSLAFIFVTSRAGPSRAICMEDRRGVPSGIRGFPSAFAGCGSSVARIGSKGSGIPEWAVTRGASRRSQREMVSACTRVTRASARAARTGIWHAWPKQRRSSALRRAGSSALKQRDFVRGRGVRRGIEYRQGGKQRREASIW